MGPTPIVHIIAGSLGIISGYVALYASKGAPLHRRAGMFFVVVMLTMTSTGVVIAAVRGAAPGLNIPAALTTAYLVVTGLTTIRPPTLVSRRVTIAAMLVALMVSLVTFTFGLQAIANGGTRFGMPAFPFFLFGLIGTLGSVGDARMLRSAPLRGSPRLARHLWRMCAALLIAAMSFFLGQADEFPKSLRIPPLLALPIVVPLVTMLYWIWRVRIRRSLRGIVGGSAPEAV